MKRQNLIKNAGKFYGLSPQASSDPKWTRETVYYTEEQMPIFMTAEKKFFAFKLNFTKKGKPSKTYKPKVHSILKNGKVKELGNEPLPKKLATYIDRNFNKNVNYNNSNKANLYSKKRSMSANAYKLEKEQSNRNFNRYTNIRNRIPYYEYSLNGGACRPYNGLNTTITQNNIEFLKSRRNKMAQNIINNVSPNFIPNPYDESMNNIQYYINIGQNMVNKHKERKKAYTTAVRGLRNSVLPDNISRTILNKTGIRKTFI